MSDKWTGKVALITGASSGIGYAMAERLARRGVKVVACARRVERLEPLREAGEVFPVRCDLQKEQDILAMFEAVRARWGGVDLLVNNAGLAFKESLTEGSTEAWRTMLEVNVLALAICTREAASDMKRRGDTGHIVHISSLAGYRVPPESGMYSATKYAVRSLTEGLRRELHVQGSSIRVSSISPGIVRTGFHAVFHGDAAMADETYSAFQPLEATDIADTLEYVIDLPPHAQVHDVLIRPREQSN